MFQIVSVLIIAVLVAADRATKLAAAAFVEKNGAKEFLFGLFRLNRVNNTGAAFSSFSSNTKVLAAVTVVVIAACLVYLLYPRRKNNRFIDASLIMIIAGGIGNEIDRIAEGFVIDFIEPLFVDFAVFNFADCCITVGAFLLMGYEIYDAVKSGKAKKNTVTGGNKKDDN